MFAQAPTVAPPAPRQQGNRRERLKREHEEAQRSLPQPASKAPPSPTNDATTFWPALRSAYLPISAIVLLGDSSESFRWLVDALISGAYPAIGRGLGVGGVNVAAERAQQALVARGFVTSRIVLGAQSIATGRLTLTLIPGRVRTIRFVRSDARANAWNAVPAQHGGDILNLRYTAQALENFKRLPAVEADIQIAPAESPGKICTTSALPAH